MSNSQKIEKEISKKEHKDEELIIKWISEIKNESTRTKAIENLTKFREKNNNLSIYLWYSRGTIAILLQEIISTYQYLSSSKLSLERSNKICAVINLFDCIASQNKTRNEFLESQIPIFLYPFLNTLNKSKPYEYIRLTALGVIGALVKVDIYLLFLEEEWKLFLLNTIYIMLNHLRILFYEIILLMLFLELIRL